MSLRSSLLHSPFELKVRDEVDKFFKLGCYHLSSLKNPKAIIFFVPDFAVSAKNFGVFFEPFTQDPYQMRVYLSDRRGFGSSEGDRGSLDTSNRGFRDSWDFFDQVTMMRGYPYAIPKVLVSHGLGSLFAAHLCA